MERLRVLLLEDQPADAELCLRALAGSGFDLRTMVAGDREAFVHGLAEFEPDLVLSDFFVPQFDGLRAVALAHETNPDLPVIIVTGSLDEETAADCIKAGAADYVLKDRLVRLPIAVRAAMDRRTRVRAQHRAEAEIRKLSRAVEQSPAVVLVTDIAGRIEYVNPRFTDLTGYALQEVLGKDPSLLKSGRTPPEVYRELWETVLTGGTWRGELQNRAKDGRLFWERASISPLLDSGGRIINLVAVKENITEWKRRERELVAGAALAAAVEGAGTVGDVIAGAADVLGRTFRAAGVCVLSGRPDQDLRVDLVSGGLTAPQSGRVSHQDPVVVRAGESGYAAVGQSLPEGLDGPEAPISVVGKAFLFGSGEVGWLWLVRRAGPGPGTYPFDDDDAALLDALLPEFLAALQRAGLRERTAIQLRQLQAMQAIDTAIAGTGDLRVTLNILLDRVTSELGAEAGNVLLLNPHLRVLTAVEQRGLPPGLKGHQLRVGEPVSGLAVLERRIVVAGDGHPIPTPAVAAAAGIQFLAAAPLIAKGTVIGSLGVYNRHPKTPDPEWLEFFQALADQTAIAVENAKLVTDLQRSNDELALAYDATIEGWVRALDLRDQETEGHTQRVTESTLRLARRMGMDDAMLVHVRRGALLHDIGKIAIPDAILRKQGPLTAEERLDIERHPAFAFEMLKPIRYLQPALDIPYCHHEKYNGKGYPRGLQGDQIPLAARLFAVVDVWDALRSDRVYRAALPEAEVRRMLAGQAGAHFDPDAVKAFLELLEEGALAAPVSS